MLFKEYKKSIKVNSESVEVTIEVRVDEDDMSILMDQDFETPAQREEYKRKVESGCIFAGIVSVTASALGLEGFDSIGACELKPNSAFNPKPFENSVKSVLKDYDLVQNAIDELVRHIRNEHDRCITRAREFKRYAEVTE